MHFTVLEWFLFGQIDCVTLVDVNDLHGESIIGTDPCGSNFILKQILYGGSVGIYSHYAKINFSLL